MPIYNLQSIIYNLSGLGAWLLLLPGALMALLVFRHERDGLTRLFLALLGGLALIPLAMLALYALPGPIPWWLPFGLATTASLWFAWQLRKAVNAEAQRRRDAETRKSYELRVTSYELSHPVLGSRFSVLKLLASPFPILFLLAATLRLAWLGNAEFQGDEAYAMLLANAMVHGHDDVALMHAKGPVEALLPAAPLALLGQVNELVARLPFALAGLTVLLGAFLLARELFGEEENGEQQGRFVPFLALLLLALDGFLIAFSRIVQYQSFVMLGSLGAIWCCWRFYRGAPHPQRYLVFAAGLSAMSMLAHYDGIFAVPAFGTLVLAGAWRRGWRGLAFVRGLAAPFTVGLGLVLSFYLPFVTHEHFTRVAAYLQGRTGQEDFSAGFFNNLQSYYNLITFYTSIYHVNVMLVLLLATLLALMLRYVSLVPQRAQRNDKKNNLLALGDLDGGSATGLTGGTRSSNQTQNLRFLRALRGENLPGLVAATWLLVASMVAVFAPGLLVVGGANLALLAFAPPLAVLALAPGLPMQLRLLASWFTVPFLAMGFLIGDPRTHFYTTHIPATLLVAWGLVATGRWLAGGGTTGRKPLRVAVARAGVAAGGVLLLLSGAYASLVFLRQQPEYYRSFPAALVPFFAPATGAELPEDGFFGFPRRDGWPVVGALYQAGVLQGDYDSNQKIYVTGWYTRGAFTCQREPDYFFTAYGTTPLYVPAGYHLFGVIDVDGVRAMDIYSRAPLSGPVQRFSNSDYRASFDSAALTNFPLRRLLTGVAPQQRSEATWNNGAGLRGYDLDRPTLRPDQVGHLTLYWRAETALPPGIVPMVEIRDINGVVVGQGVQHCTGEPSEVWQGNYLNDWPFLVRAAGLPAGDYTLHVSLRDGQGGLLPLA
ncbi:MAG: glycosyltransferase family 39 protein, partial [Chloroflexaceae bacterium]|nr:glycosyltransferase family 39 protein [Chloroflexaceae bacterium]